MGTPIIDGSTILEAAPGNSQTAARQGRKSPLAFGAGFFGISIFTETFYGYAYFFYVDVLGLALVSAAFVRTIFTLWDSINDPLMGYISDHSHSRWGRRRPWLFSALPLLMLVFFLVFSVPAAYRDPSRLPVYMLVVFLLYETLNTVIGMNYSALFPEVFRTLIERTRAAAFTQSGLILGLLTGLALSPLVYQKFGFSTMAAIYALCGGALLFASLPFNREAPSARASTWPELWPVLRTVLADRVFWLYVLTMIFAFFAVGLVVLALPFYVKYALQAPTSMISILSGLSLFSSLAALPFWKKLIDRWGLHRVFSISAAGVGCALLSFGLFSKMPWAAVAAVIYGLAVPGMQVSNIVIRAALVSRSIQQTGSQNEGFYYGMMNSALRLGGLLQALAMFLAAQLFGYISGGTPGPHPDLAFRFLISILPAAGLLLAGTFARIFFKAFTQQVNPPSVQ